MRIMETERRSNFKRRRLIVYMLPFDFTFIAKIWVYHGQGAWHFVSLPEEMAAQIKLLTSGRNKSWGSLRVEAVIGETSWKTSVFRDNKTSTYLLPIKADVRRKEQLSEGAEVKVSIKIWS